ncbi:MAG: sulfatase-like hydrolase/transferase [Planctomycetota bacterium]
MTKRYTDKALDFIAQHKESPFFIYIPQTMPHIPLYASDAFRGQSEAGLYGDTLEEIDWSVGQILNALKDHGIDDNTMVVYTSDNGPWNLKGNATDKVKGNMNRSIGGSAYPLKGFKFSKWEGGMRVPCVMRWPGMIPKNRACDEITGSIDLLPTIAKLAGAESPVAKIDGIDVSSLLLGAEESPRKSYFFRTAGVRWKNWKWINGKLFDLFEDIGETQDLASEHPDVATKLKEMLEGHKAEMKADGRLPAYHQREPFTFLKDPNWTVVRGRWNANKAVLRQRAAWTDARIETNIALEDAEAVEVEFSNSKSAIMLDLQFAGGKGESVKVYGSGTIYRGPAVAFVPDSPVGPTENGWTKVSLRFEANQFVVTIGERVTKLGSFEMSSLKVALITEKKQGEFRNLRVIDSDGKLLLQSFPAAAKASGQAN